MELSIIVPVYNSGDVLGVLLDSILKCETRVAYEIILVNDGSHDNSLKICRYYEEKYTNIRVIDQKNFGPSAARNRGLEVALGKYILFCDSDDYVSAGMIDILFSYEPSDLIIFGIDDEIWDKGKIISTKHHQPEEKKYNSTFDFLMDFDYLVENNLLYSQCTKMYRKDIIEKNCIRFHEDLLMGEDISFNLEYFSYSKNVHIITNVLYHYVHIISSNSVSSSYYKGYYENVCMILKKQKELLKEWKVLNPKNEVMLESFFIGRISSAIQNELMNKDAKMCEKYYQIRNIIYSKEANEAINIGIPSSFLYRCLCFGIRYKLIIYIFMLFESVLFTKKHIVPLIARLRRK